MSIQSEIDRIVSSKSNIRNSILNKGVDVPENIKIDNYNTYIDMIPSSSSLGGTVEFSYSSGYNGQECYVLYSDGTSEKFSSGDNHSGNLSKKVLYIVSIGSSNSSIQINSGNAEQVGSISHGSLFSTTKTNIVKINGDCSITVD